MRAVIGSRHPVRAENEPRGAARPANMALLLMRAFRWFEDGLLIQLDAAGWSGARRPHSAIFGHLDREGTTESELARRIGITRQSVHQTVSELRAMGLVELLPCPANRSAKLVVLTPHGREQVRAALTAFAALEAELAARLGEGAVRDLRRILESDWGPPVGEQTTSDHLKKP